MSDEWAGMIIRYVDGNENRIAFRRPEDASNVTARIEEILQSGVLILELEDRMMVVPFHHIKSLEVSPKPDKLPHYALRDVHIVS